MRDRGRSFNSSTTPTGGNQWGRRVVRNGRSGRDKAQRLPAARRSRLRWMSPRRRSRRFSGEGFSLERNVSVKQPADRKSELRKSRERIRSGNGVPAGTELKRERN